MSSTTNLMMAGSNLANGYQKYVATSMQSKFQQSQDQINAELANIDAASSIEEGQEKSDQIGLKTGQAVGDAKTGFASQGVVVGSGSSADVVNNIQQAGTTATQAVQTSAWRKALGYKLQATEYNSEANLEGIEANDDSSLLTGGMEALGNITMAAAPKTS